MMAPDNFASEYDSREPQTRVRLSDLGTRFNHVNDILDLWHNGIETVKHSMEKFSDQNDILRLARLEAAVKLLQDYRDKIGAWDAKRWDVQDEVNKIPKTNWKKEPTNGKPEEKK